MKTKSFTKILFLAIVLASVCSCKTITYTQTETLKNPSQQFIGNYFDEMKGKTKNQILQAMSSPKRTETDGAGGEILVYEDIKYVTNSSESYSSSSSGYSRTDASAEGGSVSGYAQNGYVGAAGSYSAAEGQAVTRSNQSTTSNRQGQSVSQEEKKYVNFFINEKGICYNVNANYGDKYKYNPGTFKDCQYKKKKYNEAGWFLLLPPCTIAGVIWMIGYFVNEHKDPELLNCGQPYQK